MPTTSGGWWMGPESELLGLGRFADSGSLMISALRSVQTHQTFSFDLHSSSARCVDMLKDCICRRLKHAAYVMTCDECCLELEVAACIKQYITYDQAVICGNTNNTDSNNPGWWGGLVASCLVGLMVGRLAGWLIAGCWWLVVGCWILDMDHLYHSDPKGCFYANS